LFYDNENGVYVSGGEVLIEKELDKIFGFKLRTSDINEIKNILPDEKPRKNLKRSCLDYFGNYPLTSDGVKYWEVFR
jgi:hypothetical protein